MEGELRLSRNELRRIEILSRVRDGMLSVKGGSVLMGVSYRQGKRVWRRYRENGDGGVMHQSRGRVSNHRLSEEVKAAMLEGYRQRYSDFGPTLALEKLHGDGFHGVSRETLRQWLIGAELWKPRKRGSIYRRWREPKEHFGELVQIDGSHHRWFEQRAGQSCLMNMVDDATGTSLVVMEREETAEAALRVLWAWVKRYGIPMSIYCDRKNVYVIDREPTLDEQLQGIEPKTPFGIACEKLGIQIITAYSPQAKGPVERKHGLYQDRLVKELRLREISTIEETNLLLGGGFVDELNARYARAPRSQEDLHCAVNRRIDLKNVFCFEQQRQVGHDYVVRDNNQFFQLVSRRPAELPRPQSKVLVRRWLGGTIHIIHRNREIKYQEFDPKYRNRKKAG